MSKRRKSTEVDENCAVCGGEALLTAVAHWDSRTGHKIIAWTCSDEHAATWEKANR